MTFDAIRDSINNQLWIFPQEKIHLHTDRAMYVPGEKIWFKAYLVDAMSHKSQTYSRYAYIELINSSDSLMHRVIVSSDENGLFHGYIFLSDFIPEGDYTLRAYTRYMENPGDYYYFTKPIRIVNMPSTLSQQREKQARANYDVSFYPEGGNFPEGVMNRIAFKALNSGGTSEIITGEVVDGAGNLIVEVVTKFAGMGSFSMIPETGKDYFLICKSRNGQEKRFKLPAAVKTCALATIFRNNRHYIQVIQSPDVLEKPLYLLIHCRGVILYFEKWNYSNNYITFSSDRLPSGVIQALLLDEDKHPVSERLIFNKNEAEKPNFAISFDKPFYQKREKVSSEINIADSEGNPLAGHISVAVTDDKDVTVDSLYTITSSLLLSSELRGNIESPGYYLENHKEAEVALDLLMLVHGWRRYDIAETFKGKYSLPAIDYELEKVITGSVKTLLSGRPAINAEVLFTSTDGNFGSTVTDSTGFFRFGLHYADSTRFMFQAKNQNDKPNVKLLLYQEKYPKLKHVPVSLSLLQPVSKSEDRVLSFIKKVNQRAQYDEDIKLINLPEVTVSARRIEKKDEERLRYWVNFSSDRTIYREEIEERSVVNMLHLFLNIPGIEVDLNRKTVSIRGGGQPLFVVDGILALEWNPLEILNVEEVETIDIFKGPSAAVFGMRGVNGAISITLKRGNSSSIVNEINANISTLIPTGYQKPVEFYAPRYDTTVQENHTVPDYRTTIYWKPDILISDEGKAFFEFYTSDFQTSYSVVIEGVASDGKIIRQKETIEVW